MFTVEECLLSDLLLFDIWLLECNIPPGELSPISKFSFNLGRLGDSLSLLKERFEYDETFA